MRSIRKNEKKAEEKARFLSRFFYVFFPPVEAENLFRFTGKLFVSYDCSIRNPGPGMKSLVRGYGGRRGPCSVTYTQEGS